MAGQLISCLTMPVQSPDSFYTRAWKLWVQVGCINIQVVRIIGSLAMAAHKLRLFHWFRGLSHLLITQLMAVIIKTLINWVWPLLLALMRVICWLSLFLVHCNSLVGIPVKICMTNALTSVHQTDNIGDDLSSLWPTCLMYCHALCHHMILHIVLLYSKYCT